VTTSPPDAGTGADRGKPVKAIDQENRHLQAFVGLVVDKSVDGSIAVLL
jgi:hypothetical protein